MSDFNSTYFFRQVSKNFDISNFMNICPVAAELLLAEGQSDIPIDMTKLIVAFRRFVKAPILITVRCKNHKKYEYILCRTWTLLMLKQLVDISTEF